MRLVQDDDSQTCSSFRCRRRGDDSETRDIPDELLEIASQETGLGSDQVDHLATRARQLSRYLVKDTHARVNWNRSELGCLALLLERKTHQAGIAQRKALGPCPRHELVAFDKSRLQSLTPPACWSVCLLEMVLVDKDTCCGAWARTKVLRVSCQLRLTRTLYVHQAAKSTPHLCSFIGTLPAAWAQSHPTTHPAACPPV